MEQTVTISREKLLHIMACADALDSLCGRWVDDDSDPSEPFVMDISEIIADALGVEQGTLADMMTEEDVEARIAIQEGR